MTTLGTHPAAGDKHDAVHMIREARVALALLERFAPQMTDTLEGRVYLSAVHDTCEKAWDWATAHCTWQDEPA